MPQELIKTNHRVTPQIWPSRGSLSLQENGQEWTSVDMTGECRSPREDGKVQGSFSL